MDTEILHLSELGATEKVYQKPKCVSPVRAVPKKNSKQRLITNLTKLNSYTDKTEGIYQSCL